MSTSAGMKRLSDCAWSMNGVRSAASSSSQRWSISKLVLKTSFSSWREEVEVLDRAALLEDRVPHAGRLSFDFSLEQLLEIRVLDREAARQRLVGVDVGRDRLDAGAGAAADDRDRRGRRDRHLAAEALHHAHVGGVGAGPALLREHHRRLVDLRADVLEHLAGSRLLAIAPSNGSAARLQEGVEAHHAEADRALALGAILGARHLVGRAGDVVAAARCRGSA